MPMPKQTKSQWDFGELFPAEATRRVFSVSEFYSADRCRRMNSSGLIGCALWFADFSTVK